MLEKDHAQARPSKMNIRHFLLPLSGAILMTNAACAGPVDRSLRPEARPSGLSVVQQPVRQVAPETQAAFSSWVDGFRGRAQAQGIRNDVLSRSFTGIGYNPDVVASDRNQSEFKREIWDYLDSAASPKRVANGQAALQQHRRTLQAIEDRFGVEKEVVTAVWGMESTYGERRGTLDVIGSLATLAYDGRRGAFFEKQLIAALQIIQAGDVDPRNMTGSWAGAMGHTQFIPTSYLAYAVDFTGDGKRDIWSDDPTDALASTAAYLKRFGWTKGQPWGVEVRLPAGFNAGLAKRDIKRAPSEWAAMGVTDMQGRAVPNHGQAAILLPAGTAGAAFMIFDNFGVIARYNNAEAYVIGVGHLSDRIKGGPEIQTAWPRGYAPLSFDERMEMQQRLQARGYPVEKIDGIIGPNTVNAIRAFQASMGVPQDGFPSQDVLALLKR
jgi:membrane-bound lytic murein transglycosylase B